MQVTGVNSQINKHRVAPSCKKQKKEKKKKKKSFSVELESLQQKIREKDDGEKREVGSPIAFRGIYQSTGQVSLLLENHSQTDLRTNLRTDDDEKTGGWVWGGLVSRFTVTGENKEQSEREVRGGKKRKSSI